MAVITRYFSTSAAGAGDGTTWADRAALFSAGNWSTVITGFNFAGSDSLKCLIGPGSYTCSQTLASGLFANAPTVANPLLLCGCDTSGNVLAIPDPDWVSAMPAWDDSALPAIATTTNIATLNLANCVIALLKFTASGRNGPVVSNGHYLHWCHVINSTSNTSAQAVSAIGCTGCVVKCTGSSYASIIAHTNTQPLSNTRVEGVAGSSGNRRGIDVGSNTQVAIERCTVVNCGGDGVIFSAAQTGASIKLRYSTIVNNAGTGFKTPSTASQTSFFAIEHTIVTGNGGYGVDAQSEGNVVAAANRLRDNTSGNFNGLDNYPTDLNNYTTDSDDATEYVSAGANGDFRIKNTAAIWGQGYGAGDQPAASGGGGGQRVIGG